MARGIEPIIIDLVERGNQKTSLCLALLILLSSTALAEPVSQIGVSLPKLRLVGHQDSIFKLDWSNDGKWILSASVDKTVRLWDAKTGKQRHKLDGWRALVTDANFSPDSKRIIVGSMDGTARVFDVDTGKMVSRLISRTEVLCVALSGDAKTAAVGSGANMPMVVYDVATEKVIAGTQEQLMPMEMVFVDGGKQVAMTAMTVDGTTSTRVFHLNDNSLRTVGPAGDAVGLAVAPDGKSLFNASHGKINKIDIASGDSETVAKWQGVMGEGRYFSSDCSVAGSATESTLNAYPVMGNATPTSIPYAATFVRTIAVSPDGKQIAGGVGLPKQALDFSEEYFGKGLNPREAAILVYDTASTNADTIHAAKIEYAHDLAVRDGSATAMVMGESGDCRLVDLESGKTLSKKSGQNSSLSPVLSPDGKLELVTSQRGYELRDSASGTVVKKLELGSPRRSSAVFSADGKSAFIGVKRAGSADALRQVDLTTGKPIRSIDTEKTAVQDLEIIASLNRLVVLTTNYPNASHEGPELLRIYDTETGKEVANVKLNSSDESRGPGGVVISDSGIAYAGGVDQVVRFDLKAAKELPSIEMRPGTYSQLALSKDQRNLLALKSDCVSLIDVEKAERVHTWTFPHSQSMHIGFEENKPFIAQVVPQQGWKFQWLSVPGDAGE